MADEEHLKILGKGVEVWNKWENENLMIRPDLSEAMMLKIDFTKDSSFEGDVDVNSSRRTFKKRILLSRC